MSLIELRNYENSLEEPFILKPSRWDNLDNKAETDTEDKIENQPTRETRKSEEDSSEK